MLAVGTMDSENQAKKMSLFQKFSYGVGHVLNDLCASMWFSYLLVYFEKVLEFTPTKAGLVLLVGQLADGASTPVVGVFSDKENKISACARYGRRKVWHLIGTICVLLSFPFIFSPCIGCQDSPENTQLVYYCVFVIVFQFGWASVQISHLALIPDLTAKKHQRTELNSIRYAFTVLSNLTVYTVAFLLLLESTLTEENNDTLGNNTMSTLSTLGVTVPTSTFTSTTEEPSTSNITPDDSEEFRNIAIFCIIAGTIFTVIFHLGVKEPPYESPKRTDSVGVANDNYMGKMDWFKQISFYQVAVLYMATRLFVNLYQVYIPLYIEDTLNLEKSAVASIPFVMYLAGFVGSMLMKKINKRIGRKATFSFGCCFGLLGCVGVFFGRSEAYELWGVYGVAALLGIGGSTLLITCLSITADLIGNNVETAAFVYAFMSFVDKVSNGIVIMLIQNASDSGGENFFRNVITFACGGSCILGLLSILSLRLSGGRVKKDCKPLVEDTPALEKSSPHDVLGIEGNGAYDSPLSRKISDLMNTKSSFNGDNTTITRY